MGNFTPIRIGGQQVACIRANVLDVRRHESGFLHSPPAIAIANQTLEEARQAGVTEIVVTHLDTGSIYELALSDFDRLAFDVRRGAFEGQRAVVVDEWHKTYARTPGDPIKALKRFERRTRQKGDYQISMRL